jgi:hypothetical protein
VAEKERLIAWRVLRANEVSTTLRERVGLVIADCQLPIFDWPLAIEPIGNRQSQIENPETRRLPRGGTDFIAFEPSFLATQ